MATFRTQVEVVDQPRLTYASIAISEVDLLGSDDATFEAMLKEIDTKLREQLQAIRTRDKGTYVPKPTETVDAAAAAEGVKP